MISSNFDLENALRVDGYVFAIGVDEAGRGPLAGPVVASAAILRDRQIDLNDANWGFIRDSKKLSEKKREKMFDFIHENFFVGVGICNHETIDRVNILEASFLAMKAALNDLKKQVRFQDQKHIILVDGNKKIPNLSLDQKAIIGGDGIVKSISAASIIAKVTRDRLMLEADARYPQYQFKKHKGYGTKLHVDALHKFGPCEIHRRTFEPVKSLLRKR